jgi:hypothetical protein
LKPVTLSRGLAQKQFLVALANLVFLGRRRTPQKRKVEETRRWKKSKREK